MAEIRGENERSEVNSGTFYFAGIGSNGDWTDPQNGDLWRDGTKTLFDPCPPGWRVPKSGEGILSPWSRFTVDNGPWAGETLNVGRRWNEDVTNGGTAWYSAGGYRHRTRSTLSGSKSEGDIWSTTTCKEGARYLVFYANQVIPSRDYDFHRAYGFSVRCLRE